MKEGRSLVELAAELERQQDSKRDFLADTRNLEMSDKAEIVVDHKDADPEAFEVTPYCHGQIGQRIGIPKKYYDRMREEAPGLLARNVNHWLESTPETRMVRTLDGRARAFLSDRFRPLDNFDLAQAVLPRISEAGCQVKSAELTESRLYIQAVTERITAEVKVGDVVQAGIVVSNSEIGAGSVRVEPMIFRLVCLNGMINADQSLRKYHVGRRDVSVEIREGASTFYKDETRQLDDRAFWAKVCDVVEGSLDRVRFEERVEKLRAATEQRIEGDPVKAVELLANTMTFTDGEQGSVLRHLIQGGDLSAYGMANAVTRAASDIEDYDRSVEFERIGGDVIELPKKEWDKIATAVA